MRQPNRLEFATTPLATGLRVHYAEQGDREGEAVLFLHAYADSWFSYGRVLPLLSAELHALVPDQRGHGDSDKPECCNSVDDYAADVDAFMDALGIEEATIVGDSSGGLIAQRVALDYPHRLSRLVLIGAPTTLVDNEAVKELGKEILALTDPITAEFVREFVLGTIHDPIPQDFLSRLVSESLKLPARVWREYYEGVVRTTDDNARLGEIDAPTLILWGEQDSLLLREEQERRAAAITTATLKVYPETGHLAHWVRPEWVVRDLEAFMKVTAARQFSVIASSTGLGDNSLLQQFLGETLMPLEEVIELLRFASSRREEEREAQHAIATLTPREIEVLQALAEGLDSREIAERLHISVRTERNHIASILSKLEVHSQLQALVFALRHGVAEITYGSPRGLQGRSRTGTWTNNPCHNAWDAYMDTERAHLAQRATGQMRRAIGRVLKGESQVDLERIAAEDQHRAKEGMVPLREDGKVYYEYIDDLTCEDVAARMEAERVTVMWLRGRIEGERIAAQLRENNRDQRHAHNSYSGLR